MGGNFSDLSRSRATNLVDTDRIRPTSEQKIPKHRSKLANLALVSTKSISKLSFKRKRGSKENVKFFKELISSWPISDILSLYKEMSTAKVVSEARRLSDCARPIVLSVGTDLIKSETKDLFVIILGERIALHKFFINTRCEHFKNLIANDNTDVIIDPPFLCDSDDVSKFINYLYTEEWNKSNDLLYSFKKWSGCHRSLADDLEILKKLSYTEGDVVAVLSHSSKNASFHSHPNSKDYEIRCHMPVLSARSRVLANLLKDHRTHIVLEEALLPRAFAPALIHFLYTDNLNLSLISDSNISQSSLSEARAIVSGRSPNSALNKAIHLLQIAKFFSLNKLVQHCEDVIVSQFCTESCAAVLAWALDGGSLFVARQAQRFIEEEFTKIAQSHHIFDLSLDTMISCVSSQFTQATEVDILDAVVKWGEHELLKRMEEREPNVVADTTHSISRRGVRRSDLSSSELSAILSPLTGFIRTDLILPPFHQSLTNAYRRGILEQAPLRNLICSSSSDINPDIHWFRPDDLSAGPRFYEPYFEELKSRIDSLPDIQVNTSASSPVNIELRNVLPDLIDETLFEQVKNKILSEISLFDCTYHLRDFPRFSLKKLAVDYISLRVLREMDIPSECIEIIIEYDSSKSCNDSHDLPDIISQDIQQFESSFLC